ncbi:MAG: metal-dependent transcriptional regulator [Anaerolineae bacterium]|nr:metal-dependent transcriptional regulator [Anaerolineae bacterium]
MTKSEDRTITPAIEDYLKTIYVLQQELVAVTTTAIAERLNFAAPSVTNMLKKLADLHLVHYTPYQGVELTPAGEKVALEVIRHHRLLELYLIEALGYSWDQVHDEADRLEHVISEQFEERIDIALGRPTLDPHGDPIPTKDGNLPAADETRLVDLEVGQSAVIVRVAGGADVLRYVASLGLLPQITVHVLDRAPFNGPLTVRVGEERHALGRELAEYIFVAPVMERVKTKGD